MRRPPMRHSGDTLVKIGPPYFQYLLELSSLFAIPLIIDVPSALIFFIDSCGHFSFVQDH